MELNLLVLIGLRWFVCIMFTVRGISHLLITPGSIIDYCKPGYYYTNLGLRQRDYNHSTFYVAAHV